MGSIKCNTTHLKIIKPRDFESILLGAFELEGVYSVIAIQIYGDIMLNADAINYFVVVLFCVSFMWIAGEVLRKKQNETAYLLLCGVVPGILKLVGVPSYIGVVIAFLCAAPALWTACHKDEAYRRKVLRAAIPIGLFYLLMASLLLAMRS